MTATHARLTAATIDLEGLAHNLRLLQAQAPRAALWPVIKANAYGHGATLVGAHLARLGYGTVCVADVSEAVALHEAGLSLRCLTLSATLPAHAEALVAHGCEPVVQDEAMVAALHAAAQRQGTTVAVHVKVDTGMGRVGLAPDAVPALLERCRDFPAVQVRGLMSHFATADEPGSDVAAAQLERFQAVCDATRAHGIPLRHMANSAALLDWPAAHFDAARPGLAIYGLAPAPGMANPAAGDLQPVLRWHSRITALREVPPETGLSYGHTFHTAAPALIATVAVGYGDGLHRRLSNRGEMLVHSRRCPIVGRVTMDMTLLDVTALRGRVAVGDEVVLIGAQGGDRLTAEAMADLLGTVHYEVVTAIAARVARVPAGG